MAFDRSKGRSGGRDSRDSRPRGGGRGGDSRGGRPSFSREGNKSFDRGNSRFNSRDRPRNTTMTKVTCSSCGNQCEVPFKPNAGKPVYCSNCFIKDSGNSISRNSGSSSAPSKELKIINEKLDKIMKALKIE